MEGEEHTTVREDQGTAGRDLRYSWQVGKKEGHFQQSLELLTKPRKDSGIYSP
jgi:hypothetical protein